jgi:hypothetical protein
VADTFRCVQRQLCGEPAAVGQARDPCACEVEGCKDLSQPVDMVGDRIDSFGGNAFVRLGDCVDAVAAIRIAHRRDDRAPHCRGGASGVEQDQRWC